ncbi:hypothetical protein LINPERHAP1_LOCUS30960, partial [Linum perenne]
SHSNFAGGITIQVEELAFLIRDNLRSKHLVLAMEDTFVNFLQHDTSSDGVLELEPMDPYNRLLLHRLADIFGDLHQISYVAGRLKGCSSWCNI